MFWKKEIPACNVLDFVPDATSVASRLKRKNRKLVFQLL